MLPLALNLTSRPVKRAFGLAESTLFCFLRHAFNATFYRKQIFVVVASKCICC